MRVQYLLSLAIIAVSVVACGGGGGGGSSTPTTVVPNGTATTPPSVAATPTTASGSSATLTITIPKSSGSALTRRPQDVASQTQSIVLQLIAAGGVAVTGTPQTFALTATSPGCSAGGTGTTCTISIAAPVGLDVFTAETFASTTGNGTLLSTGAFQVNVQQNATNAAAISLNGTVASLYLASVNGTLGVLSTDKTRRASVQSTRSAQGTGTAATQSRIYIIALDSNNNIILNPTIFNTPITLQLSFEYGYNPDVTLSDTPISGTATSTSSNFGTVTVTSPSDVVTATLLNGATNPSSYAYIAGYLNGAPPAPAASAYYSAPSTSVPQVVLQVNASSGPLTATYNPWSLSGSYSYNYLSGGSGDYTYSIGTSTCSGIATLYIGYGYELVAQPLSAGSCSVTITDESSDSITIPITVTSIAVTGS